jgi:hypothetical protein
MANFKTLCSIDNLRDQIIPKDLDIKMLVMQDIWKKALQNF